MDKQCVDDVRLLYNLLNRHQLEYFSQSQSQFQNIKLFMRDFIREKYIYFVFFVGDDDEEYVIDHSSTISNSQSSNQNVLENNNYKKERYQLRESHFSVVFCRF